MAVDNAETEYHLTPTGWETGRSWFFSEPRDQPENPPADRVLTVIERTYQASAYSPETTSFRVTWRAQGEEERIQALKKEFPLDGYC